jgi:hypothetical protein
VSERNIDQLHNVEKNEGNPSKLPSLSSPSPQQKKKRKERLVETKPSTDVREIANVPSPNSWLLHSTHTTSESIFFFVGASQFETKCKMKRAEKLFVRGT